MCVRLGVCVRVAVCLHTKFVRVILTLPLLCSIYKNFCIFFVGTAEAATILTPLQTGRWKMGVE